MAIHCWNSILQFTTSDEGRLSRHKSCLKRKSQDSCFKSMNGEKYTFTRPVNANCQKLHTISRCKTDPVEHPCLIEKQS